MKMPNFHCFLRLEALLEPLTDHEALTELCDIHTVVIDIVSNTIKHFIAGERYLGSGINLVIKVSCRLERPYGWGDG